MGGCNCAGLMKPELGAVNVDDDKRPKLGQSENFEESDDIDTTLSMQALVRAYFQRRPSITPAMSFALQSVYKSLPEFSAPSTKHPVVISDGIYQGELSHSRVPDGLGRLYSADMVKEGSWIEGKLNGKCRIVTENGEVFVGMFKDNVKEGYGEFTGATDYKGQWKNDLPHGKGAETWKDGSKYEGDYLRGLRTGKGVFVWPNGSKYEGHFKNNKIEGQGCYWTSDGKSYRGDWKNNMMHGQGKFKWQDGKTYEGEYYKNEKQGQGTLTLSNGKRYEGQWLKGKQHGQGTLLYKSYEKRGEWKEGKYVG